MGVYSLDTSAVVKRYVSETGSVWINALCDPASGNSLHIARITPVEVVSALARRHRKGDIDQGSFETLVARFQFDLRTQYEVVEIGPALVDEAMRFARAHAPARIRCGTTRRPIVRSSDIEQETTSPSDSGHRGPGSVGRCHRRRIRS